jgi:hypothetical protein
MMRDTMRHMVHDMMRPPRTAELLLDGLIANAAVKDAVLGDFAEEWAERASRDGARAANRWYRWQVLRSVPPLVRAWPRHAGWLTALGVIPFTLIVRVVTLLLGVVIAVAIMYPLRALGGGPWASAACWTLGNTAGAFLAGVIAARVYARAPMVPMLWLTVVVFVSNVSLSTVLPIGAPSWWLLASKAFECTAVLAGGIVVMRARRAGAEPA